MKNSSIDLLEQVLRIPTAPFREERVIDFVKDWCNDRPVSFRLDRSGNVILRTGGNGNEKGPCWVLAAHMDHPAFVATKRVGRLLWAEFRGGVRDEYFANRPRVVFRNDGLETGGVLLTAEKKARGRLRCRIELDHERSVPPGTVGSWDLPPYRRRGRKIWARACDDLAGVAAVLAALDMVSLRPARNRVTGLLTRAEEVGFVGAMAACRNGVIPSGAHVVAIETSREQPGAGLGDGVVVRVGDRTSVFDGPLTDFISKRAAVLAEERKPFRYVRALMPGGTCEATVYCAFGYSASGLCLPLGNYHNMGSSGRPAPERIDLDDYENLVALLVDLVDAPGGPARTRNQLRARLERRFKANQKYL